MSAHPRNCNCTNYSDDGAIRGGRTLPGDVFTVVNRLLRRKPTTGTNYGGN